MRIQLYALNAYSICVFIVLSYAFAWFVDVNVYRFDGNVGFSSHANILWHFMRKSGPIRSVVYMSFLLWVN